jgi:hypothetical protein
LPYVPLIPKTEEEKDEKKYNEEFNPDRDGLPNGTQDLDAPAPHGNLITVDAEEILEIDAVSEMDQGMKRIPKEQRVLVMCECGCHCELCFGGKRPTPHFTTTRCISSRSGRGGSDGARRTDTIGANVPSWIFGS